MRAITFLLAQNIGDGSLGATLDVTSKVYDPGPIRWEADERLTKLTPGDFDCSIHDADGTVWAWLQTQTPIAGALYPPYLAVSVDGERKFTGVIAPERITRDLSSRAISISAQSWDMMLVSNPLGEWVRPVPKAASGRPGETKVCNGIIVHAGNQSTGEIVGAEVMGLLNAAEWLHSGDIVTWDLAPGEQFKVLNANRVDWPNGDFRWRMDFGKALGDAIHRVHPQWGDLLMNITRPAATNLDSRDYYLTTEAVVKVPDKPTYEIPLDTIDGITSGDTVQLLRNTKSATWTVLQVDVAGKRIITREEVGDLPLGSMIYFTPACTQDVVFTDVREALIKACYPFRCDYPLRYAPPTLPVPVLVWLPLRPMNNLADLTSVKDMDAGLTSLRVFGSGAAGWDGTPEAGWATATGPVPRAGWTDQLLVAPSSLMPDETLALSPSHPRRYRPVDLKYRTRAKDPEDAAAGTDPGPWTPTAIPKGVIYDYLGMRRVQINTRAVTINTWSGTAWSADATATWPGALPVLSLSPFPGGPAGMILGLTTAGLQGVTLPGLAPQTAVLPIPTAAADAVLRTTPWGAYLVGSKGYGRITHAAGALSLVWVEVMDPGANTASPPGTYVPFGAGSVFPGTFAAVDVNNVMVLVRYEAMDSERKVSTETHMLMLRATPVANDAGASMLWDEKVFDGAPVTAGAMRDPSISGRAIGHCGGRLFQVSATLPISYAIERFTPSKMNSSELLEHVCQLIHAVAVPDATGVMQIVSRSGAASMPFTVDQVSVTETRAWEHFYSVVRVTGAAEGTLWDAYSSTAGGKLLEVSKHPLIWGESGCVAMAESLVAWFGHPRRLQEQEWFWTDPNTAPPWESLAALSSLTVNGDPIPRILMSMEYGLDTGKATATLVEA